MKGLIILKSTKLLKIGMCVGMVSLSLANEKLLIDEPLQVKAKVTMNVFK
ncbi:hypothetical protein ACRS6K_08800 [Bacillus cytotoxicus]|nr:hypothetical protein [Bacillus cytotoxicus]MDH2891793.1 hypothetical protein [Bacillus cytotoxicus]HDR7209674.1 hypothetical protein [Bacillus cytotoxicus]